MPYEKPKQNSGKGDVYASGGAFDDGPDDKDDFWKRPGGGLERTLYEWSLEKLSIILTLTGLQPYKKQQRRPAIYLVVWHDGWRSTNIAIPVELWRVMVNAIIIRTREYSGHYHKTPLIPQRPIGNG